MRKKTHRIWFSIAFLTLASLACTIPLPFDIDLGPVASRLLAAIPEEITGRQSLAGSGTIISESRSIGSFDRLVMAGFGKVILVPGSQEELTITCDDNIMPYIISQVNGDRLELGFTHEVRDYNLLPTETILFRVTYVALESLEVSGAGDIQADQLQAEQLALEVSGAGNIILDNLALERLMVDIGGAGNIKLTGHTGSQEISMSGAGSYQAPDLQSARAKVTLSGVGSATLWAIERLDVAITGLGSVSYYGSPAVEHLLSGLGSLNQLGER